MFSMAKLSHLPGEPEDSPSTYIVLYKLWPWLQYAEEKDVVISQFEAEVQ